MTTRITSKGGIYIQSPPRWIGGKKENPATGMVRWDIDKQCLQVYTGDMWTDYVQDFELTVHPEFQSIVDWARAKMIEEEELKKKLEKYPGLRDSWEQFKMLEALAHEEDRFEPR